VKDLTKGNIYKTFFLFGLPLVLAGVLSQTYHVIDTMIAGKFIGEHALASMGAISPLISFVSSLLWGYCTGFSIYIAQLFSAKNYQKIKNAVYTSIVFLAIVCTLLGALIVIFHKPVFSLLNVDESLHADALAYACVYCLGFFFIISTTLGSYLMNSLGIGSFTFFMSLISAALNIGGNLLTVLVLKMGVKGLAVATVFATVVVDVCYFFKFKSCLKELGADKEKAKISFYYIKNAFPFSLPSSFQQGVMYLSSMLISPLVNRLGVAGSASYSVVAQVYNFNAAIYQNSARAVSNYSAQCMGSKQIEKVKKGVYVGFLQGIAFLTPFLLVCVLLPKPVCSLFFKENTMQLTKEFSYLFCEKYLPFLYFNVICNLFHALFRGVKATTHLFCTTFFASIMRYIFSVSLIPGMGISGFYLGWVLSWITESVLCIALFFIGKWKPRLT